MKVTPVEKLFSVFDETSAMIQEELACTYLDALIATGENLFQDKIVLDSISELTKKRLQRTYAEVSLATYTAEEIRKAFQLAILKGMKGETQPNHQMTPDSIGLFIGYLTQKFLGTRTELSILDPAVGTGNLLSTIVNIHSKIPDIRAYGVEIDETLIKLAYIGANLLKQPTELFHQDALASLFVDPVDLVVSDLPVGYYPDDIQAKNYTLQASEGHAYAHHLFIEQSIRHTKPGGYLFFLIPNGIFESKEAPKLQRFLKETVYIQGVLQLPFTMFKDVNAAKSIIILQKKSPAVKPPKEVLLANLPKLSNRDALDKLLIGIDKWFKENK